MTFSGEDAHNLSEAKEEAAHTVVEFVKAPDLFQVLWGPWEFQSFYVPSCVHNSKL